MKSRETSTGKQSLQEK